MQSFFKQNDAIVTCGFKMPYKFAYKTQIRIFQSCYLIEAILKLNDDITSVRILFSQIVTPSAEAKGSDKDGMSTVLSKLLEMRPEWTCPSWSRS